MEATYALHHLEKGTSRPSLKRKSSAQTKPQPSDLMANATRVMEEVVTAPLSQE